MQCHDSPQPAAAHRCMMDLPGDVLGVWESWDGWGVSQVLPGVSMSGAGNAPDSALGRHGASIWSESGVVLCGGCATNRLGT
jgi:hypothetical protein